MEPHLRPSSWQWPFPELPLSNGLSLTWRVPCRVDLVGGTLDIWPICAWNEPIAVVNVAIDVGPTVQVTSSSQWVWEDQSSGQIWRYPADLRPDLALDLPVLFREFWAQGPWKGPYHVIWQPDEWSGAGLGHSSSLLVGLLKTFAYELPEKGRTWRDWWQWLVHVETRVLGAPAGVQDYVPAITGGACLIVFDKGQWSWMSVHPQEWNLPLWGCLIYSQQAHHSGLSNFQVIVGWVQGDRRIREGLRELAQISRQVWQDIRQGHQVDWKNVLRQQREVRLRWQPDFEPPVFQSLVPLVQDFGGTFKVVGAGFGGSCFCGFWDPEALEAFYQKVQKNYPQLSYRKVKLLPSARISLDDFYPDRVFPI